MSEQSSMTSELAVRNGSSEIQWTDEQKHLVASTIAPGCTPDELRLFAYHCHRTRLDPFSRQIYAIKRKDRRSNTEKMTIQVSIDGLRAIAERTGELGGSQRYWCGPDGEWKEVWLSSAPPAAAKCVVYRKGCPHPFVGVALFRDYNNGMNLWTKMPSVMIGKCAEAQALRAGFPADLSGLYVTEEMDQADRYTNVQSVEVAVEPQQEIAGSEEPASEPVEAVEAEVVEAEQEPKPAPAKPKAAAAAKKAAPAAQKATTAAKKAAPKPNPSEPDGLIGQLKVAIDKLSPLGQQALIKAYSKILAFAEVETIEEFFAVASKNDPQVHLNGLNDKTIPILNEGKHPRTGEVLVTEEAEEEPQNPFDE
jgi:phage recombination protein Bet